MNPFSKGTLEEGFEQTRHPLILKSRFYCLQENSSVAALLFACASYCKYAVLGPVVQSVVSLTNSLRVISSTFFSGFNTQYSDIFC